MLLNILKGHIWLRKLRENNLTFTHRVIISCAFHFFLKIRDSVLYHLPSAKWTSFSICSRPPGDAFSLFFSNIFILSSFWRIFLLNIEFWVVRYFFLLAFKRSFHCLLSSTFFFVSSNSYFCDLSFFFGYFNTFYFCLLTVRCLHIFFVFSLFVVHWTPRIYKFPSYTPFGKFSAIMFSDIFLGSFFLSWLQKSSYTCCIDNCSLFFLFFSSLFRLGNCYWFSSVLTCL